MPTIQYSKSPNVDTAFVVQDDGTKNRTLLVAPQDTSTLELPENPNSTKGYVTVDGKKHRVVLTAEIGNGGGGGSIDYTKVVSKTATMPTASASNANIIYLYDGETNGTYHHGYIYENKRSATYTSTVSFEPATSSGTTVTCSGSNFATFLTEAGANPLPIVSGTMTYEASGGGWRLVGKDADDQTITTFFEYNEDYADAGFTFTGTPVDGDIIAFTCTVEEDTVTYAWTRLDVQPGGAGAGVNSLNGQTGDLNIKSVNGHALLGSGNLELSTYLTFPNSWTTNSTTKAFCDAVAADNTAVVGKAYLGEVTFSDLPASMANAEVVVEIMAGTTAANKVILLSCTSGNTAPYKWQYTYWNNGTDVSGWQGFQEQLVSGTNIKTVNNTSLLGAGDITIDSLPSQTGQSGKFLTTDGTDASWATLPSGGDFVPQLSTLPTAGATNVGDIVQYSGTTDANYTNGYFYESTASYSDPSATISQTTGSGLTDLAVNVNTFIAAEQPAGDESVVFTAIVTTDSATYTTVTGSFTLVDGNLRGVFENYGWPFGDAEHNGVIVFNNSQDCYIGPEVGSMWFSTNVGVLESYGFQFIGTPTNGDVVQYSYTDGSTSWTKGGETVNPADYGVSYSGVPNNGDALTVVYTAPAITGYLWEQKDVQPAPDVPDVGIEWKTSVDLPGNFQEGSWGISPVFKINGGLPDGIYEFYYQIKTGGTFASAADFIPAIVTFRYIIKVDNSSSSIQGMFAPVIDGEWIGNNGKRVPQEEESFWSLGWKDGNGNLYFWADSNWWNTDLHGYVNPCPDVSDCFRLSAIKNLTTGQEYIAEGSLYDNVQPGSLQMASQIVIKAIQVTPNVPSSTAYGDIDISVLGASQTLFCQGIRYESGRWINSSELTVNLKCGADRFSARFQAFVDEYVLTIDEATGIFENTGFVKTANNLYVKLNLPAGTTSGIIQAQYAMKDMTMSAGCSFYNEDITGQATTQLIPLKVGVAPSVANYLGKILQYEGATDANYTNGYFYKATGNVVNVPGSVTCTETSGLGKTITMDVDGFLNYMIGLGYDQGTIENWLNNRFIFEYNVDANSLSWNPMGVFPDSTAALQYFTFSPAAASGEYIIWTTSNYVAAHADVQNAAWTEVKTQQSSTTPSTMPTLIVANWSSNTQTVTVQGVTADNNVIVAPAPASSADWASGGVLCTAQGTNSLTFTCTQTPSNDITVNVIIL